MKVAADLGGDPTDTAVVAVKPVDFFLSFGSGTVHNASIAIAAWEQSVEFELNLVQLPERNAMLNEYSLAAR